MHDYSKEELITRRYSCRTYRDSMLSEGDIAGLNRIISQNHTGPFGSGIRFMLKAASSGESSSLKELGTYGFIKNPAAFIIGAAKNSGMYLEDYGYVMESIILEATGMNLGTCWLGGSFRRSRFAEKIGLNENEIIPAVASVGYISDRERIAGSLIRAGAGAVKRMPAGSLFFDEKMKPLTLDPGSVYSKALEMVRIAPSANNKQPWRIIKSDGKDIFHFYLDRSALYSATNRLFKLADLQRIDIGIAMCHFELIARENNAAGSWGIDPGTAAQSPSGWEYITTWTGE